MCDIYKKINDKRYQRIDSIEKSFVNQEDLTLDVNDIQKAKKLPDGTIRTHGGKKVIKQGGKWKPHSDGNKSTKEENKEGDISNRKMSSFLVDYYQNKAANQDRLAKEANSNKKMNTYKELANRNRSLASDIASGVKSEKWIRDTYKDINY